MKDEGPASIPPPWLESDDDPAALLLQRNQERLAAAISIGRLGTFEWDVRTGEVRLDDRSHRIFGFADGEGGTADEVFARIHPDVQQALEVARRDAFEAYILDIGLPGMDGHELAGRLRQLPHARDATFIALSGYGQERDRRASLEAGFQHHHVKPLDPDVLRRLVAGLGATAAS